MRISRIRKGCKHLPVLLGVCLALAGPGRPDLAPSPPAAIAALLRHADEEGLDPADYRSGDLAALTAYANDLALGRADLRGVERDVALPAPQFTPQPIVAEALRSGNVSSLPARLAPPYPEYMQLKQALARYRTIAAAGGWPRLQGAPKAGELLSDIPMLPQRLAFEDNLLAADPDAGLADALKRFQSRHGLASDGVLGRATLAALNVPAAVRADTILANMERWRWLRRTLETDRIIINAAAAELVLILGDQTVLTSRVIVGRPKDRTPILRAEAASLTVNPPWNIPTTIAAQEILPRLKRDHAYLVSQDMILLNGPPNDPHGLSVNWRAIRAGTFPYRIQQHPGPKNPLGQVKLELPNRFDVYLHDTPGREAFGRIERHLSHGCVRVEKILPLASYVLSADLSSMEKINAAIGSTETVHLPLRRSLPVYFLYWTAFSDGQGNVSFRDDVYGRDARLLQALRRPVAEIASAAGSCPKA